jgi:putative ABC transport system ATP-binding protein
LNPPQGAAELEAKRLDVQFRDVTGETFKVLSEVSAQFRSGQLTAVVGPSGSGKTTLLHCLAGIQQPTSGEVCFGNVAISQLSENARDAWRQRTCGMVFQDFRLIGELSVIYNVLTPALFNHFRIPGELRERASSLLQELGVPLRSPAASRLSRGERQRVAIARALLMNPAIVLADEPTASLDRINAASIAETLQGIAAQGKIVICVTHDDLLASRADQVIHLDSGQVVTPYTQAPSAPTVVRVGA